MCQLLIKMYCLLHESLTVQFTEPSHVFMNVTQSIEYKISENEMHTMNLYDVPSAFL